MTAVRPFDRAAAVRRLGPAAVATARRIVDAAPPLSIEQREQIRAAFATARHRKTANPAA